jgi:hypothetical protein
MDLPKVLRDLHEELANLNAAIASLERLQEAGDSRRRSSEWLANVNAAGHVTRRRKSGPKGAGT